MSGPTFAELSIVINSGDAEAKVRSLGSSLDTLSAKERQRAAAAYADRFQTDAQARAMGLAETQAYKLAAAQNALAATQNAGNAAGVGAAASINRVREAVTSMTSSMLQAAPGVAQLTSVLGAQALGGPIIVGVLAGIAAVTLAWRAWHEEANKARVEQDKLTASLLAWYETSKQGPGGELPKQIEAMTTKVKELKKQLDDLTAHKFFAGVQAVGQGGSKAAAWTRIFTAGDFSAISNQFAVEVAKGTAKVAGAITDGGAAIEAARKEVAKREEEARQKEADKRKTAQDKADKEAEKERKHQAELWTAYIMAASNAANEEVRAAQRITEANEKQTKSITDNVVAMQKQLAERFKQQTATAKSMVDPDEKEKKFADQMKQDWIRGIDDIIAHGMDSYQNFFESVLKMFTRMLDTMQKASKSSQALSMATAAVGGGLAGYQVGQGVYSTSHGAAGNYARGALGGAASGAMAGYQIAGSVGAAVGAVAGFVGGIIGVSNAAKEAAKQMAEMQKALAANIAMVRAEISGDTLGGAIAQEKARFDALRKQTEDAYSGGGSGSEQVQKRNAVLAQLNALEAQRIQQLRDEAALTLARMNQDIEVQILRNNGSAEEADALEKAIEQERRFAELRKAGITDATLEQLRQSEAKRDADAAALDAANKLKEAAEAAAQTAADAAVKFQAQQKAVEDINVELLRAKGQGGAADDLEFQLAQERRTKQALADFGADSEYVTKLNELQQIQRDQRAVDQLIGETDGRSTGRSGSAAAVNAVSGGITERSAFMLLDLTRAQNTTLDKIEINTRNNGGGGGGTTIQIRIERSESFDDLMDRIRDELAEYMDQDLATTSLQTTLRGGSVRR